MHQGRTVNTPYPSEHEARLDALCRPLTIAEVLKRTGRSERTIRRWVEQGRLRRIELKDPPETVYIEREVLEVERDKRRAPTRGRHRPAPPPDAEPEGVVTDGA